MTCSCPRTTRRPSATPVGGRSYGWRSIRRPFPSTPAPNWRASARHWFDRLLSGAVRRGRYALVYLNGLNLSPYDLTARVRRALTLPDDASLEFGRMRPLDFAQAVFWFEATFVSDQKEDEILSAAVDLHSGRQVRHLDQLLGSSQLAEEPSLHLAEARRQSVAAAYPAARQEVLRTLGALANVRRRELSDRLERQVARMARYYADLRDELDEQVRRAVERGDDLAKFADRRKSLDREEQFRVAELRQKSALRVHLKLIQLLVVRQPKVLIRAQAVCSRKSAAMPELELVWDPLMETLEAASCPKCGTPTMAFEYDRRNRLACPRCACAGSALSAGPARRAK